MACAALTSATPKLAPKITPAQRRALLGLRNHGNPAYGVKGASAWGGFRLTEGWLLREGLCWTFGHRPQLSPRGMRVLDAGRLVP